MNDEERIPTGDRAAFEAVAGRYRERIFRYLITMIGDEARAEDLVQETFRRAWDNLDGFEGRSKFLSWLYRIAVNLTRNHLRDEACRARHKKRVADEQGPSMERRRTVLSSVVRHELSGLIASAVDRLPVSLREAFTLVHVERIPYPEAAAIAEVPVAHMRVRVQRARNLLREQLGDAVDSFWTEETKS